MKALINFMPKQISAIVKNLSLITHENILLLIDKNQ